MCHGYLTDGKKKKLYCVKNRAKAKQLAGERFDELVANAVSGPSLPVASQGGVTVAPRVGIEVEFDFDF
jgi:hypothetical protein